jgi:hypothetical protein
MFVHFNFGQGRTIDKSGRIGQEIFYGPFHSFIGFAELFKFLLDRLFFCIAGNKTNEFTDLFSNSEFVFRISFLPIPDLHYRLLFVSFAMKRIKSAAAEYRNKRMGYFESFFIGMKKYQQKIFY